MSFQAMAAAPLVTITGLRRAWSARQRALVTPGFRAAVLLRDGRECRRCGCGSALVVDHDVPVSRWGETSLLNCNCLCASCNRDKGDLTRGLEGDCPASWAAIEIIAQGYRALIVAEAYAVGGARFDGTADLSIQVWSRLVDNGFRIDRPGKL